MSYLDRHFELSAHGTTVRTEILAGATTFLTMAYISFVQPAVLSAAGMDFGAVLVAPCLATSFATAMMGIIFVLTAGIGLLIATLGLEWAGIVVAA